MFIDAIYYVSCNFYKKREADIFKVSGLVLLSTAVMTNVLLILMMMGKYWSGFEFSKTYEYRYFIVGGVLIMMITLFYFRFFKRTNYDEIDVRIKSIKPATKAFYQVLGTAYLLLSFISAFAFAIIK
jgi:uncharacterized membrane protein